MEEDIEENLSTPNSWIPLKAIKKIMGMKTSPRVLLADPITHDPSYLIEDAPNKSINSSSSFVNLHRKYTKTEDAHNNKPAISNLDEYAKALEIKIIRVEKEKLEVMGKLEQAESEVYTLKKTVANLRTEHMIKLQSLQEQHERKLHKTKKDIDFLLKEMNNKSNLIILDDFIRIHLAEIERCRMKYEEVIKRFLLQGNRRDWRNCGNKELISSMSKDLEEMLEDELLNLKERYENQIEKLKDFVQSDSWEGYYDDELSTGLNSERATSELKASLLESTLKLTNKSSKSSFFHN